MDYRIIGKVGFAENHIDFKRKSEIDNKVILEIINLEPLFKIPKEYEKYCGFEMKLFFDEDNGPYKELVLTYDLEKEDYLDVHFWSWVNKMENYRFQQLTIKAYCEKLYNNENCNLKISFIGQNETHLSIGKFDTFEISVSEGLTNSQMYTRDKTNESTINEINFNERFKRLLNVDDIYCSRKDFSYLITDIFTHYRNIRSFNEGSEFFNIGKFFKLK